jgi:hypothetical protein
MLLKNNVSEKLGGKRPKMTDLTPEQSMQRLLKNLDKTDEFKRELEGKRNKGDLY